MSKKKITNKELMEELKKNKLSIVVMSCAMIMTIMGTLVISMSIIQPNKYSIEFGTVSTLIGVVLLAYLGGIIIRDNYCEFKGLVFLSVISIVVTVTGFYVMYFYSKENALLMLFIIFIAILTFGLWTAVIYPVIELIQKKIFLKNLKNS